MRDLELRRPLDRDWPTFVALGMVRATLRLLLGLGLAGCQGNVSGQFVIEGSTLGDLVLAPNRCDGQDLGLGPVARDYEVTLTATEEDWWSILVSSRGHEQRIYVIVNGHTLMQLHCDIFSAELEVTDNLHGHAQLDCTMPTSGTITGLIRFSEC